MKLTPIDPSTISSPAFGRMVEILMDHLTYAEQNPDKLAEIARRLNAIPRVPLAVAMVHQIFAEFAVTQLGS